MFSTAYSDMQGFLTSDEITLFYKQGYLLKAQCLSQEEIANLKEDVTEVIDQSLETIRNAGYECSKEDQVLHINESRVVFKQSADGISIARVNGCAGMKPRLLEILRSKKIVHTFLELLGTDSLEHLISQIHPKLPQDGIAFPGHRDIQFRRSFDPEWEDVLGNGSYAICIIPVDPMTMENGGLWIDRNNYPEPQGIEEDIVWIEAKPGDLFFMHPHLYHGSGVNSSAFSRKTLLTGFCAFGANHKAYPGAHVNTRLTLTEEELQITDAPWRQTAFTGPGNGH